MSDLKDKYLNSYKTDLKKELNIDNICAVPEIKKVVISSKTGSIKEDASAIE
jgi:ribosomal protein L5